MPPVLNYTFCMRAFAGPELVLDLVSRGERGEKKKTENTQYSLQVSKLHLPLHIDLINSYTTCTGQTTLRPLSVSFLGRGPEERLAKDSPRCTHQAKILIVRTSSVIDIKLSEVNNKDH